MKNFDKEELNNLLEDNKDLLIPIIVLAVAVILFLVFILPNIFSVFNKKSERDVEVSKLNELKAAKNILTDVDKEDLEAQVEKVTNALPTDKNFELILGAISLAAQNSGVQISSYAFGDSGGGAASEATTPQLMFNIGIDGGITDVANFISEIYSVYPVSSVKSVSYSGNQAIINIGFYYQPFTSVQAENAAIPRNKTPEEISTLEAISTWNTISDEAQFLEINTPEPSGESEPSIAPTVSVSPTQEAAPTGL